MNQTEYILWLANLQKGAIDRVEKAMKQDDVWDKKLQASFDVVKGNIDNEALEAINKIKDETNSNN